MASACKPSKHVGIWTETQSCMLKRERRKTNEKTALRNRTKTMTPWIEHGRVPQLTFSRSRGAGQLRYSSELNAAAQKLVHGLAERGYAIAFDVLQTHTMVNVADSVAARDRPTSSLTSSAAVRGPGASSMRRISVSVSKCLRKNVDFSRGSSANAKCWPFNGETRYVHTNSSELVNYRANRSGRRNICTRVCSACRPCARSKATSKRAGSWFSLCDNRIIRSITTSQLNWSVLCAKSAIANTTDKRVKDESIGSLF